jgi:hypothetical protein
LRLFFVWWQFEVTQFLSTTTPGDVGRTSWQSLQPYPPWAYAEAAIRPKIGIEAKMHLIPIIAVFILAVLHVLYCFWFVSPGIGMALSGAQQLKAAWILRGVRE